MITRRLPFFFALLLSISGFAESSYEKGLTAFLENERDDAIDYLEESIMDGDQLAESHLVLCFIYSQIYQTDKCYYHMKEFLSAADDPYPYLITLWGSSEIGLGGYTKDKERLALLNELIASSRTPWKLKIMCYDALVRHYKSIGKFDEARAIAQNIGMIQQWSSVGPFDNLSGSGFNKDFGVLDNPEPTHSFSSTYGASIKWFQTAGPVLEQWMNNYYTSYAGSSIIYSQTFINAPKEQEVQLRFGVGGAIKIWLNDHLIYQQFEERDNDIDTYILETKLAKGNNRLLIQVGESESGASEFLIRITDKDGMNINNLTFDAFGKKYSGEDPGSKLLPNEEEAYFENRLAKEENILDLIMLAKAYSRNDQKYLARKTINKAIAIAPNSSYLQLDLAYVYLSENNRTGVATIISWLKQNDLKTPVSLSLSFQEAMTSERFETADSILSLYYDEYGPTVSYFENSIELAFAKEDNGTGIRMIELAYEYYPDYSLFAKYKSLVMSGRNNNKKKAIKIVKKYLKKNYEYDMYVQLANYYFEASNGQAGVQTYEKLSELLPYAAGPIKSLAEIYYYSRAYNAALAYVEKVIDLAPYVDEYWGLKGMILEEMDEYSDAEEAYERCIELNPNNYDIREKLRLLTEEKSLYELFGKVDYYDEFKNSPPKDSFPDDNSAILRYDEQTIVYNGGGSEQRITMLVKVFNSAGIDDWKEYWIPVYYFQDPVIEKIEVIKANGSRLEAESEYNEVVFTNLEPGDGILIIYKIKNYYFGKLTFNFWDHHYFTLDYPCVENSYSLMIHKDVTFQHKFSNGGWEPNVTEFGEFKLYEWKKKNIPSVKEEDYMSEYVDFGEVLFISTFPNWTYISNWYSDLAAAKSTPNFEVKETVAQLFEGKENLTDREKVEIIYTYIVKNIRYSSISFRQSGLIPQKADAVLSTKIGDCKDVSTLFVAMCKEAGIEDAGLVLVNTRDNGMKDLMLPSISFNHCIGRVTLDGETYYVELTSEHLSFLSYGEMLNNAFVLEVYDESTGKEVDGFHFNPENKVPNTVNRKSTMVIDDRNMHVSMKSTKSGHNATSMKYSYKDIPESERREALLKILNEDHKSVKLETLVFDDFDTLKPDFNYSYDFLIENHISKTAGLNIFEIPWSDAISSTDMVSDEDRSYPVELWLIFRYDRCYQETTIELPTGARLAERPKNVNLDSKFATYKLTFKYVGNSIIATRELIPKMDVVPPEDFDELKKFISQVVEYDTQDLAYRL